jgi:hypothetical protein
MACKFVIQTSVDLERTFNVVLLELKNYQGSFTGDFSGGFFTVRAMGGEFAGNFKRIGQSIQWEITKKPFLIPCSLIETFLRQYLNT